MTNPSSNKRVIYQLCNNQNINIENFRSEARPIAKPLSISFSHTVGHKQLTELYPIWYCREEVEGTLYSDADIDEFNKYLWVEREFCTDILKLLKKVEFEKCPHDVFMEIFGLRFTYNLYNVPKSKLANPDSSCKLASLLNELDDFEISRHRLNIKSNNLRRNFDFDTDTLPFIKKAITCYLQTDEGKHVFNALKKAHDKLRTAQNFVKSIQQCKSFFDIEDMKREFARNLNSQFITTCSDANMRYYVIGELMIHAIGTTKHYENAGDKMKYHCDKIRKLLTSRS